MKLIGLNLIGTRVRRVDIWLHIVKPTNEVVKLLKLHMGTNDFVLYVGMHLGLQKLRSYYTLIEVGWSWNIFLLKWVEIAKLEFTNKNTRRLVLLLLFIYLFFFYFFYFFSITPLDVIYFKFNSY